MRAHLLVITSSHTKKVVHLAGPVRDSENGQRQVQLCQWCGAYLASAKYNSDGTPRVVPMGFFQENTLVRGRTIKKGAHTSVLIYEPKKPGGPFAPFCYQSETDKNLWDHLREYNVEEKQI